METTEAGAHLHRMSAVGNWNASAPVRPDEQRTETAGGVVPQHAGEDFTVHGLYVHASRHGGPPRWQVYGPNIRQDGTDGQYTLRRAVTREYATVAYPAAVAALNGALSQLAGLIRADADTACAEISMALPG